MDYQDEQIFRSFYRKTGRAAVAKSYRIVRRRDVAEEIAHDCFLDFWAKKVKVGSERQAYQWIYKACHNRSIDYLRKASTKSEEELPDQEEVGDYIDELNRIISLETIKSSLALLSQKEAAVFLAMELDQMKQTEVAELFGISTKTVSRLLRRASKKLVHLKGGNIESH